MRWLGEGGDGGQRSLYCEWKKSLTVEEVEDVFGLITG